MIVRSMYLCQEKCDQAKGYLCTDNESTMTMVDVVTSDHQGRKEGSNVFLEKFQCDCNER
jgi:hypothetical protein